METPPGFVLARRVFLALLGLSYVSAFGSFAVQAPGLMGEQGVVPFRWVLGGWATPSLLLLWRSDAAMAACWMVGLGCGAALIAGKWPRAAAALAYALYLSLVSAGGLFFSYQWDVLLLETGFLAIFLAARARPPSAVGLFLSRALLFKLMVLSGAVKLASGDPAWRDLTAFQYHYWSQPLPTWTAYFADLAPLWFDRACGAAMFAMELGAPWLLFGPRRARHLGAALLALLQLIIAATGNYGFFNLVTLCLCGLQIDDAVWRRVPGLHRLPEAAPPPGPLPPLRHARWVHAGWVALAVLLLGLGSLEVWRRFDRRGLPGWLEAAHEWVEPFHVASSYGLFAVMTKDREEIDLEGSDDGATWKPYRFPYKPGPLDERPRFAPLHMPRLDWQMWFASLGSCPQNEWLLLLQLRLLEGRPAVRALFDEDPFPDAPPRYLRTRIAPYGFAAFVDLRARGTWWTRGGDRPYCPVVTLDGGRLRAVQQ